MDKVRIGIVGLGGMGSGHASYLTRGDVPNAELTAVCDVASSRLDYAKSQWGDAVARYDNHIDLLESGKVDGVLIATPHYFHPPVAIDAFARGKHVLSEKPPGVYTKQVRLMNEAAEASGLVFGVMFNQRMEKRHQKLRELLASGEIGEIRRVIYIINNWFRSQSYYDSGGWRATWAGEGGGVLMNQCPHNLDLWQWWCGMPSRVRSFISFGKYHDIEVDDDVTAYVEYPNGATGVFLTSTGECPGTNRIEVHSDRGKVVMEGGAITFWRTRQSVSEFSRTFQGGFGEPEVWKIEVPAGHGGGGHSEITRNWTNAITKGSALLAPGIEGINTVQLNNAMLLSAWTDSWVDIPVDEDLYEETLQAKIAASAGKKATSGQTMDVSGTFNV
ncbi:MAG: Gfo/Idh/MocA family oxidoreductase [Armatimonadetes bacterium]|nr:Gfo/Idh/MocA family oxidoreductase [Armatimonadota bacterium]